ncbi:alpha-hydroxy-acid oxidizing protein, partial [Georgenia sp. 10Sc9-8]|nr:alpha-hydroxy-acid oxidizing protein [Georgenia halotolerans]
MQTPQPTWDDIRWLREEWGGEFMVKGIMRVDDAKAAVDAGATAISVSNHGGNNLDGTPASIRVLPAVADAVGDQVEVLMDGGIRR